MKFRDCLQTWRESFPPISSTYNSIAWIWVNYSHKTANVSNEDEKTQQKLMEWHQPVNTLSWMALQTNRSLWTSERRSHGNFHFLAGLQNVTFLATWLFRSLETGGFWNRVATDVHVDSRNPTELWDGKKKSHFLSLYKNPKIYIMESIKTTGNCFMDP